MTKIRYRLMCNQMFWKDRTGGEEFIELTKTNLFELEDLCSKCRSSLSAKHRIKIKRPTPGYMLTFQNSQDNKMSQLLRENVSLPSKE